MNRPRSLLLATALMAAGLLLAAANVSVVRADEDSPNVISVGYGEGKTGDQGIPVIITARNDVPLHGYSLAIRYNADALEVVEFNVEGTHVAQYEPQFVSPKVNNIGGFASLGVILNYDASPDVTEVESTPSEEADRIIARMIVNVRPGAKGGAHPIELLDGIGQPPVYNRFANAGRSIAPTLCNGSFRVRDGDSVCLDKVFGFPGASINLPVLTFARHPDPLSGFQVAFAFDCREITHKETTFEGTDLGFELGRDGLVEFFQTDVDTTISEEFCRSRTGVIFDYLPPFDGQMLSASPDGLYDQSILLHRFDVAETAADVKQYQDLRFDNRDAPGSLNNVFLIGSTSVDPQMIHGKIYFSTGVARARVVDRMTGAPVAGARVRTIPDNFETTTGIDGSFEFAEILPGEYSITIQGRNHYVELYENLTVTGGFGGEVDDWGLMSVYRRPRGTSLDQFLRGDANSDGRVDISDAVWGLNWLFKGAQAPSCFKAFDANADNGTDISDTIFTLRYLFSGEMPPPPPFDECGEDPNDSPLPCESSPCNA
ncbi:MAG: carboxypeptidase regulatory-like domain-containing protein [Planctomycetota bacterium]